MRLGLSLGPEQKMLCIVSLTTFTQRRCRELLPCKATRPSIATHGIEVKQLLAIRRLRNQSEGSFNRGRCAQILFSYRHYTKSSSRELHMLTFLNTFACSASTSCDVSLIRVRSRKSGRERVPLGPFIAACFRPIHSRSGRWAGLKIHY